MDETTPSVVAISQETTTTTAAATPAVPSTMTPAAAPTATTTAATTVATTAVVAPPASGLQQSVHNAAELGWAIAELLGRCFTLPVAKPVELDWSGGKLMALQGMLTPREKLRALVEHIRYLADTLQVSDCFIDNDPDPDNGKRYIDVIRANVKQLCKDAFDPANEGSFEQLRGKINERVFFWDLKIHDALQDRPAVIHKAYLVGYSLGSLRWCFGLVDTKLDNAYMQKVLHEYLPTLGPYLSQFSVGGLTGSVPPWWDAIMNQLIKPGSDVLEGFAPGELQQQGHIWSSLLTGECDALSYVNPTIRNRPFIWQVFGMIWPLFLLAILVLLVFVALVVFVVVSYHNQIVSGVAALAGFLATFGVVQTLQRNAGDILQKAVSEATATLKGSYLDQIWNANQQKAVNQATFIPPPIVAQGPQAARKL
ncbi:MAG TPA: hypothetical protein VFQ30_01180 [Ktedonobacteraceae bacterium]|nr:hypothetical protein [Ktedonobacteraceae bacterium]